MDLKISNILAANTSNNMTKISLEYNGKLRCNLIHDASESQITTDAPTDNHGLGETFSPTDLIAAGLGSCICTVLGIRNEKENLGIISMDAQIEKIMKSSPREIKKISTILNVKLETITETRKTDIVRIAENCPVALSLNKDLEQEYSYFFTD